MNHMKSWTQHGENQKPQTLGENKHPKRQGLKAKLAGEGGRKGNQSMDEISTKTSSYFNPKERLQRVYSLPHLHPPTNDDYLG